MDKNECSLSGCLYFNSIKVNRLLTKIAEEEFAVTGLSPTYAFAVTIINKVEGISATELSEYLHMAPSTITRFVDKLVHKELVERKIVGKNSFVYPTDKSKKLQIEINKSWENLSAIYSQKIGDSEVKNLLGIYKNISEKLE